MAPKPESTYIKRFKSVSSVSNDVASAAPDFLFVNTTGPSEKDQAQVNTLVRSHVMKDFRKSQALRRGAVITTTRELRSRDTDPGETETSTHHKIDEHPVNPKPLKLGRWVDVKITQERAQDQHEQEVDTVQSVKDDLGVISPSDYVRQKSQSFIAALMLSGVDNNTHGDPFDSLSIRLDNNAEMLLYHYKTAVVYSMMTIGPHFDWLSYAITDKTLFHGTLALSALHLALVNNQKGSRDLFLYQNKAIKTLNEKLADPVMRTSNATLCTIAFLALTQNLIGNVTQSQAHMNVIDEVVSQRGGLEGEKNDYLRNKILWTDSCSAISWNSAPRYAVEYDPIGISFAPHFIPHAMPKHLPDDVDEEFHIIAARRGSPVEFLSAARDINYLATILSYSDRRDVKKMDEMAFSNRFYCVERRVIGLLYESTDPSLNGFQRQSHAYTACCLTLLIYVYSTLREIPRAAVLYDTMIGRLLRSLKKAKIVPLCLKYPKLVMWMLCTGGAVSFDLPERLWFVKQLAVLFETTRVCQWSDVEKKLGGAIFETVEFKKRCLELWDEVELLKNT